MKYLNQTWSNLTFNASTATGDFVSSLNWRYQDKKANNIQYVSNSAYKSVFVHVAKQLVMQTLAAELNSVLPRLNKMRSDAMLQEARTQQEANFQQLIKNGEKSVEGFGYIVCEGGHKLIAKTKYGTPVPEALILSYEGDDVIDYEDVLYLGKSVYQNKQKSTLEKIWNPGNEIERSFVDDEGKRTVRESVKDNFRTKTVFHIDLAPKVTMNSTKNIVLTKVQGRDFTRKELVSGGDLTYSVSGSIVSDQMGVYPSEAVKRFIKIMQHGGVVDVNFFTFGLLGVKQIIITDFSLDAVEYKNIQPYSFKCVAVEPDEAIKIKADTISAINKQLVLSKKDKWFNAILDSKLGKMAASTAANVATSSAISGVGAGFDKLDDLISNI